MRKWYVGWLLASGVLAYHVFLIFIFLILLTGCVSGPPREGCLMSDITVVRDGYISCMDRQTLSDTIF